MSGMDERPRNIPEMRGVSMRPESREAERDRERPYTAESYAAQYGITIETAREMMERSTSHRQIVRQITTLFTSDPDLRRQALFPSRSNRDGAA